MDSHKHIPMQEEIPADVLKRITEQTEAYMRDYASSRTVARSDAESMAYMKGRKDEYLISHQLLAEKEEQHKLLIVSILEIEQAKRDADKAAGLRWVEIKPGCEMPEIDEFVIWRVEDGNYFVAEIDKDDTAWWNGAFLYGGKRGMLKCTHWARIQGPGESPASVTDQRHADPEKAIAFAEEMARQGWTYHGDGRWFNLLRKKGLFATTAEVYREVYPEYIAPVDSFLEWMDKKIAEAEQEAEREDRKMEPNLSWGGRASALEEAKEKYLSLHPQAKP